MLYMFYTARNSTATSSTHKLLHFYLLYTAK